jgi:hypothetical protein
MGEPLSLGGWRWLTAYNEVKSLESITTLAGIFRAFKIDRLIDYTISDGNIGFFEWTYYYTHETQSVVKNNFVWRTKLDGIETELEYTLVGYLASSPRSVKSQKSSPSPSALLETEAPTEKLFESESDKVEPSQVEPSNESEVTGSENALPQPLKSCAVYYFGSLRKSRHSNKRRRSKCTDQD